MVLQANKKAWPNEALDPSNTFSIQWNPSINALEFYEYPVFDRVSWVGVVQCDGSILKRRGHREKLWILKNNVMSSVAVLNGNALSGTDYHRADDAEFERFIAEWRERASDERESSREFWNSVSQGLGAASTQLQVESEAQQLREAERRSAIMRSLDAELRAMDRRLAEQQRETASKAQQQSAQRVREDRPLGSIILDDTLERDRKFQAEQAEKKRQADAEEVARQQRQAQAQARSDAAAAARRAEAERRRAKDEAERRAHLAACAARGEREDLCARASRQ